VQEAAPSHLPTFQGAKYFYLEGTKAHPQALERPDGAYTLPVGDFHLVVDPSTKGEAGDIVVVWPRKKSPVVARRLARCVPYDTFHFRALGTGGVFELRCNRLCAIRSVAH